jgi:MFS family permease
MLVMAIALAILGLAFRFAGLNDTQGAVSVLSLMVYVGAFAISLGPIFWLLIAEIYPLQVRGLAMGIATTANWAANLVVSLTFLTFTERFGPPLTFWLYGLLTVVALIFAYKLVPETKGRTLEAIEAFWRGSRERTPGAGPPGPDVMNRAA